MSPSPASSRGLLAALLLPAALSACVSWYQRPVAVLSAPLAQREQVQLFVEGRTLLVHAVLVHNDTVWAVPYHLPPSCDSCVRRIAVADLDSVRLHCPGSEMYAQRCYGAVSGRTLALAAALLVVAALAYAAFFAPSIGVPTGG